LVFEVYCPKYSTAYFGSPPRVANRRSGYLSVFITLLTKKYVNFYRSNAK